MKRYTGNAKFKRDETVRRFSFEHPHYTEKEIGEKYGLSQPVISRILHKNIKKEKRAEECVTSLAG